MDPSLDGYLSDDEIFFGKMSLKEVKKRIFMDQKHRQMSSQLSVEENPDESLKLIETHSEPDIIVINNNNDSDLKSISTPELPCNKEIRDSNVISADDTFIRLERMVSDLCMSTHDNVNQALDNTLDVVDFILNNAEVREDAPKEGTLVPHINNSNMEYVENKKDLVNIESLVHIDIEQVKDFPQIKLENGLTTPSQSRINIQCINDSKVESKQCEMKINDLNLECEQSQKCETKQITKLIKTPCNKNSVLKTKENNVFKTPKTPVIVQKNVMSAKKTPNRTNNYQHITSPIASYIKNCPQIPLLKDVLPSKPLPGTSSIPKLFKPSAESKTGNKENVQLPSIAYKSAKKTKMVITPTQEKMPRGEWPNKLTNSLKKPVVIKHDHRVINSMKHLSKRPEDSFGDLTLQQADLSVCTKKSAFVKQI